MSVGVSTKIKQLLNVREKKNKKEKKMERQPSLEDSKSDIQHGNRRAQQNRGLNPTLLDFFKSNIQFDVGQPK